MFGKKFCKALLLSTAVLAFSITGTNSAERYAYAESANDGFVDCSTLDEAQNKANINFSLSSLPEGYSIKSYRAVPDEQIEILLINKDNEEVALRKENSYENTRYSSRGSNAQDETVLEQTVNGKKRYIYYSFVDKNYKYEISAPNGISASDINYLYRRMKLTNNDYAKLDVYDVPFPETVETRMAEQEVNSLTLYSPNKAENMLTRFGMRLYDGCVYYTWKTDGSYSKAVIKIQIYDNREDSMKKYTSDTMYEIPLKNSGEEEQGLLCIKPFEYTMTSEDYGSYTYRHDIYVKAYGDIDDGGIDNVEKDFSIDEQLNIGDRLYNCEYFLEYDYMTDTEDGDVVISHSENMIEEGKPITIYFARMNQDYDALNLNPFLGGKSLENVAADAENVFGKLGMIGLLFTIEFVK